MSGGDTKFVSWFKYHLYNIGLSYYQFYNWYHKKKAELKGDDRLIDKDES